MLVKRCALFAVIVFLLTFLSTGLVLGAEDKTEERIVEGPPLIMQESAEEPEMQWIWGEVVSVDVNARQLVVKYLDYETDTDKEIALAVDDSTTFENVTSLDGIQVGNSVGVDFLVSSDGRNIAKNISVEQPEPPGMPQALPGSEGMPEGTPPADQPQP